MNTGKYKRKINRGDAYLQLHKVTHKGKFSKLKYHLGLVPNRSLRKKAAHWQRKKRCGRIGSSGENIFLNRIQISVRVKNEDILTSLIRAGSESHPDAKFAQKSLEALEKF